MQRLYKSMEIREASATSLYMPLDFSCIPYIFLKYGSCTSRVYRSDDGDLQFNSAKVT